LPRRVAAILPMKRPCVPTGHDQRWALAPLMDPITAELGSKANVDYGIAYENFLSVCTLGWSRSARRRA
jgi:hypothetical protein